MTASNLIPLTLAIAFSAVLVVRLPRLSNGKGQIWLWLAHLGMAIILYLSVQPIYLAVDAVFGSKNFTNLLSHIVIAFAFYAACSQVALSIDRLDILRRIQSSSVVLLPLSIILMSIVHFFSDLPYSSMGLNDFKDDPMVIIGKLAMYLYPACLSAFLIHPLKLASRRSYLIWQRRSQNCLGIAFFLAMVTPLGHIAALANRSFYGMADLFVYPALLFGLLGFSLNLVARLLSQRTEPSTSTE